jgi:hypothetical protein
MALRSSLHSVGFKPKTVKSILKVPSCPTTEPTPWRITYLNIYNYLVRQTKNKNAYFMWKTITTTLISINSDPKLTTENVREAQQT